MNWRHQLTNCLVIYSVNWIENTKIGKLSYDMNWGHQMANFLLIRVEAIIKKIIYLRWPIDPIHAVKTWNQASFSWIERHSIRKVTEQWCYVTGTWSNNDVRSQFTYPGTDAQICGKSASQASLFVRHGCGVNRVYCRALIKYTLMPSKNPNSYVANILTLFSYHN